MKVEMRFCEIELVPENDFERDALKALHNVREVKVCPGRSADHGWPPDPRLTNVILKLPNQDDWGT